MLFCQEIYLDMLDMLDMLDNMSMWACLSGAAAERLLLCWVVLH
jgi:hypothetical protein